MSVSPILSRLGRRIRHGDLITFGELLVDMLEAMEREREANFLRAMEWECQPYSRGPGSLLFKVTLTYSDLHVETLVTPEAADDPLFWSGLQSAMLSRLTNYWENVQINFTGHTERPGELEAAEEEWWPGWHAGDDEAGGMTIDELLGEIDLAVGEWKEERDAD